MSQLLAKRNKTLMFLKLKHDRLGPTRGQEWLLATSYHGETSEATDTIVAVYVVCGWSATRKPYCVGRKRWPNRFFLCMVVCVTSCTKYEYTDGT